MTGLGVEDRSMEVTTHLVKVVGTVAEEGRRRNGGDHHKRWY